MKGLELSERYYLACGKDLFRNRFGSLMDRVAVGLAGPGSECFGFDDEYSRDHDWGPSFCLWVTRQDFERYGRELQDCYDGLPKEFLGFGPRRVSPGETGRVGVIEIQSFFKQYTGLDDLPESIEEWDISSANLALCVNGKVFSDPLGRFTQWRNHLLGYYPEDLWLKKIADACMRAGQAGQYNWQRGLQRNDPFVIHTAKAAFCQEILNMVFLVNKVYAPYYKWMFAGVRDLPFMGEEIHSLVGQVLAVNETGKDANWQLVGDLVNRTCVKVIAGLGAKGITREPHTFLIDLVPSILGKIKDQDFRSRQWQGESDRKFAKKELIAKILEQEWEMFSRVNDRADTDPSRKDCPTCRDFPDEFRLHRRAQLMAWSEKTLGSYLDDINTAAAGGKNLMTYKYARMEGLIPCVNGSRFIDLIVTVLVAWQEAFIREYPRIMSGGRPLTPKEAKGNLVSFETYLRGELETYSEKTLAFLYDDILICQNQGSNFPKIVYTYLVREKGYDSLDQAEEKNPRTISV